MSIQFREVGSEFDASAVNDCLPFVQSTPYFVWNTKYGRKGYRFAGSRDGKDIFFAQFFVYTVPMIQALYAPLGPITSHSEPLSREDANQFTAFLSSVMREEKVSFIRVHNISDISGMQKVPKYLARGSFVQPRYDRIIPLNKKYVLPEKVRKSVNKAKKESVSLEISDRGEEAVNDFLMLLTETGRRKSVHLHSEKYYRELFALPQECGACVELLFAICEGRRIAAAVLTKNGKNMTYLFGATSEEGEKKGAQYFLQSEAIQLAMQSGMERYSFGGSLKDLTDTRDPFYGVSFFKQKFGGLIKDYGDSYDLVRDPIRYRLYTVYKFLKR